MTDQVCRVRTVIDNQMVNQHSFDILEYTWDRMEREMDSTVLDWRHKVHERATYRDDLFQVILELKVLDRYQDPPEHRVYLEGGPHDGRVYVLAENPRTSFHPLLTPDVERASLGPDELFASYRLVSHAYEYETTAMRLGRVHHVMTYKGMR